MSQLRDDLRDDLTEGIGDACKILAMAMVCLLWLGYLAYEVGVRHRSPAAADAAGGGGVMTQLQEYEDYVRHIVREITRDFFTALLVVTFAAYTLGLLVGAAISSRKCDECGKQLKAVTRPAEVE